MGRIVFGVGEATWMVIYYEWRIFCQHRSMLGDVGEMINASVALLKGNDGNHMCSKSMWWVFKLWLYVKQNWEG